MTYTLQELAKAIRNSNLTLEQSMQLIVSRLASHWNTNDEEVIERMSRDQVHTSIKKRFKSARFTIDRVCASFSDDDCKWIIKRACSKLGFKVPSQISQETIKVGTGYFFDCHVDGPALFLTWELYIRCLDIIDTMDDATDAAFMQEFEHTNNGGSKRSPPRPFGGRECGNVVPPRVLQVVTKDVLKECCRKLEKHIPSSKSKLISILSEPACTREELSGKTLPELRALAKERHYRISGSKKNLIDRLTQTLSIEDIEQMSSSAKV